MMTNEEFATEISKLIGDNINDDITTVLEKLKADRAEMMSKITSNDGDWERKYKDLHDKYISRFFADEKIVVKNDDKTEIVDDEDIETIDEIIREE